MQYIIEFYSLISIFVSWNLNRNQLVLFSNLFRSHYSFYFLRYRGHSQFLEWTQYHSEIRYLDFLSYRMCVICVERVCLVINFVRRVGLRVCFCMLLERLQISNGDNYNYYHDNCNKNFAVLSASRFIEIVDELIWCGWHMFSYGVNCPINRTRLNKYFLWFNSLDTFFREVNEFRRLFFKCDNALFAGSLCIVSSFVIIRLDCCNSIFSNGLAWTSYMCQII